MVLVNIFYHMAIISFIVTCMFAIAGFTGTLTNHPIRRFCFEMIEDAGLTCLGFVILTVIGLLFV